MRLVVVNLITGKEIFASDSMTEVSAFVRNEVHLSDCDPVIVGLYSCDLDSRILFRLESNSFARARYNI